MDSKKPWQSKTILLAALLGVTAVVHSLGYMGGIDNALKEHQDLVLMGISGLGIVLRLVTKGKISIE
jgi:hypothetical protein